MKKHCKYCGNILIGNQKFWCSRSCYNKYQYYNDKDYRNIILKNNRKKSNFYSIRQIIYSQKQHFGYKIERHEKEIKKLKNGIKLLDVKLQALNVMKKKIKFKTK